MQNRRKKRCALMLVLPLLVSAGAFCQQSENDAPAENIYEDRITVTATGEEQRVRDLPVAVTVLTREEIDNSQEESVADLLERVPGVTVLRFGGDGDSTSMFVRGTESDHVLALYDGVRLNSPYFAGYDWSQQTTAGVERVEVIRGPYSALWGSDAVGGVVNVVPTRGRSGAQLRLFAEGGEGDWQRLEGSLGWGDESWDVSASAYDREGEGELGNSDFANQQLMLDAGYSWSESNRIGVLYQDLDAEHGIPFSDPTFLTPYRRQDSVQELVAVPIRLQPTAVWSLELTPSLVERQLFFRDPDDPFGFTSSDTFADTTQVRLASHHDVRSDRAGDHDLSWGGEWREDEVDASSNFGIDLAGTKIDLNGYFAQDVWRATSKLTVIAGLRYDDTSEWGSEVSPRLSLGFEATESIELRASYGEAFRQPSVGELYFPFSGNPTLEPERSESAELGLALNAGKHRIDLAAFATDTENLIDFELSSFSFANVEQVEIRGVEAAWSVPITGSILSSFQATWLDTEDQDGLALIRRPEWSSSWALSGRLGASLRGDLAIVFVGERDDVDAVNFARKSIGSHVTADLGLSYELTRGFELTARVQNLADRSYQEIDGYPAPGRRLIGGIRWSM